MVYNVKLYKNTGFNKRNRPLTRAVLETAESTEQEIKPVHMFQNLDRASIRVESTWDNIKSIDYCAIGYGTNEIAYYFVSGIDMKNPMTAELVLEPDDWTTAGGYVNLTSVTGWVQRRHMGSGEDTLFGNILNEPWTPTRELTADTIETVDISNGEEGNYTIIGSTIDLSSLDKVAQAYYDYGDPSGEPEHDVPVVYVPQIENIADGTVVGIGNGRTQSLPNLGIYWFSTEAARDGVRLARSLGVDNAITACYKVPISIISGDSTVNTETGLWSRFITVQSTYQSTTPYRFGSYTPANNKVYVLYNSYQVVSNMSGGKLYYEAKDLYSSGQTAPSFRLYADACPNGAPYIQPSSIRGATTKLYQDSVRGGNWVNTPISFTNLSGSLISEAIFNRDLETKEIEYYYGQVKNATNTISNTLGNIFSGNFGGAISSAVGGGVDIAYTSQMYNRGIVDDYLSFQTDQNVVVPDIKFTVSENQQLFESNLFYIMRVRLSDTDMQRLDKYLTMFGYAVDEQFMVSHIANRSKFNYIKTFDCNINMVDGTGLRQKAAINDMFNTGVRLWKELPNEAAFNSNPVQTPEEE